MADNKLRYYITGDSSSLNRSLNTASGRLKSFGRQMRSVGQSLQRFSALGALAGGAAIKMGSTFDKNITKIKALVGGTEEDFKNFEKAARQMAKVTGISSAETSDAMFFIASAGLTGSRAMDVLEMSSKAAAAGLGSVSTIADLSTSAMNAFGISATQATDVLTAAVREGKLDASSLAQAMGSVLPTASAMGVEFNEVGAAMAAMSRTGTDAASGATQLNAILSALLKTTPQAEKGLAQMGLSSAQLRQQIQEEGLLSVLDTLRVAIDGNTQAASEVFPRVQALRGVLDLTGKGAATTTEIFNELKNASGATATAFDITAKSASHRLTQALNDAKESFAEVGTILLEVLLPVLRGIAGAVKTLFNAFTNLDTGTQQLIAGAGIIALALPTLISLFGTLSSIVGALLSPIGLIAAALAGVAYIIYTNWAEVAPVIVGIYNQFVDLFNASKNLRVAIFGIGSVFKTVFISIKVIVLEFVNVFKTMWKLIKAFSEDGFDASFGDILKEGFEEGKQIAIDGGKEIADAFTDGYEKALSATLEKKTVEQLNGALSQLTGKAKEIFSNFMSGFGFGDNLTSTSAGGGGGDTEGGEDGGDTVEETTEKVSTFKQLLDALGNSANVVGEGIKGAFLGAFDAMMQGENVFKALGRMILDLIKKLVAAAAAAFVLSLLMKSIFPGASADDAKGALKGMGNFKNLMTQFSGVKFAKGGIVSAPTLGLMGEYPGARSNPEVIAPLDKLKNLIGETGGGSRVEVGGQFTLKGQDLVVALQRADRNRNRIK